jgi:hypothetical protein
LSVSSRRLRALFRALLPQPNIAAAARVERARPLTKPHAAQRSARSAQFESK